MEESTGGLEMAAGEQTANEEPESPRDEEAWVEEKVARLACFRDEWARMWSDAYGGVDKRTEVGPMQFTMEPVPSYAGLQELLQIFSVKVVELKGTISWPKDVYGLIAVRDSMDRNRNYIFERGRDNCQTLTAQDSYLVLTGPSRAVQLIDPVVFEVELRVKMTRPSEDKVLSAELFDYNYFTQRGFASLSKYMESGPRCTLEFKYAHLQRALEATIEVRIAEGSANFCANFVARTANIDEIFMLLDCREERVSVSNDGAIVLSRNVVVVGCNVELTVGVQARQNGEEKASTAHANVAFTPRRYGWSHGTFDVGFCKMSVAVAWSMLL